MKTSLRAIKYILISISLLVLITITTFVFAQTNDFIGQNVDLKDAINKNLTQLEQVKFITGIAKKRIFDCDKDENSLVGSNSCFTTYH